MRVLAGLKAAFGRLTDVVGRRRAGSAKRAGIVLEPYRGFGTRHRVLLIGRVVREPSPAAASSRHPMVRRLARLWRRLARRGIAQATLCACFAGAEQQLTTDRDGYFRIDLRPLEPLAAPGPWHEIAIELSAPTAITARGQVFIPGERCRFVVISDIDDTVMFTGVANRLQMMWRLFMQDAESRVAFPGMARFLAALHEGAGGEHNPMLYVSRAPWSLYEILDRFFHHHGIPVGPILFLREWGMTFQSPLPRRARHHKLDLIDDMLSVYDALPFILIGDSGQHDPEIYAQIVHTYPGRVRAIYIRNVSRGAARKGEIEALAAEIVEAGSTLVLATDTMAMAEHAAAHGLIADPSRLRAGDDPLTENAQAAVHSVVLEASRREDRS